MNQDKKQQKTGYPFLFSPLKVGLHQMKNRLVALPVHTGFAHPDGRVSSWMTKFYARLADSGVGMVIVANTAVAPDGMVSRFNLRADKDEFIPGLAGLAKAIKRKGVIACLQLNHAGRFAKTERPLLPSPMSSSNLSFNVESLKGFMEYFPFEKRFNLTRYFIRQVKAWRGAMNTGDRNRVIDDFIGAAFRAYQAGFDMVELHGANGYLLCQYLSPFTNKIASGFGGDFLGRTAFPLAVIKAVKKRLPKNFPLGFRLLLREWVPDGIDLPEALAFAKLLEKEGVAYLSASAGTFNSIFSPAAIKKMNKAAYLRDDVAELKKSVEIPTIISGRITTPSLADKLVRDGTADLIGLGRPLRTDPMWVKKAKDPGRKITPCVNCNWCLKRVILEQGFNCSRWPRLFRERTELEHKLLTRNYKTLWLISDIKDMQTFKFCLPLLVQDKKESSYPTILFIREETKDHFLESAQKDFIQWTKNTFEPLGFTDAPLNYVVKKSKANWESAIHHEIIHGNHGQIFIGADKSQLWRKRMLYKERGKVLALLGSNNRQHKVIVPVDLSTATLLVMTFLQKTYIKRKGFSLSFVHVLTGQTGPVEKRWKKMKKIAGFNEKTPLQLILPKTDVVSALTETIQTGKYGTVIMGKRGLVGLKRWLLGSVSSGVLRHLTDQSLFLID